MNRYTYTNLIGITLCVINLTTLDPCFAMDDDSEEKHVKHNTQMKLKEKGKEEEKNSKKIPTYSLKTQAKDAAKEEAWKIAYGMTQNKEEASLIYQAVMKGKKLKFSDPREKRTFSLIRNAALQGANIAAYKVVFESTQSEEKSSHIMQSLKLGESLKGNPQGHGKSARNEKKIKIMTMSDLKVKEEKRLCTGQTAQSLGKNIGEGVAKGIVKGFMTGGLSLLKKVL